jgi:two-component system, NtrC family, response regulator AtoC
MGHDGSNRITARPIVRSEDNSGVLLPDGRRVIFRSKKMGDCLRELEELAARPMDVLIIAERGTGKELYARALHYASGSTGPLVAVNCGAIPESLLASELFGCERGAFTGADRRRQGHFEAASGGMLHLDEIGDFPLESQTMLLRVMEEGEFRRLGGSETIHIKVRIVAATNKDLLLMAERGEYRADLVDRFEAVVWIPPLRERPEDILLLADFFLRSAEKEWEIEMITLSTQAQEILLAHNYPGNIRELRAIMRRAAAQTKGSTITADTIQKIIQSRHPVEQIACNGSVRIEVGPAEIREMRRMEEQRRIIDALLLYGGNQAAAARHLGISKQGLAYKLNRLKSGRPH